MAFGTRGLRGYHQGHSFYCMCIPQHEINKSYHSIKPLQRIINQSRQNNLHEKKQAVRATRCGTYSKSKYRIEEDTNKTSYKMYRETVLGGEWNM